MWQMNSGKSEREVLQDSSESGCGLWFGNDGTNHKTGGHAGGVKDFERKKISASEGKAHCGVVWRQSGC